MKKTVLVQFNYDLEIEEDRDFLEEKEYAYFTDLDLQKGDRVVVHAKKGLYVAVVVQSEGLEFSESSKAAKWVVSKLDLVAFEKKLYVQRKAQEIRNRLMARKNEMEEMFLLQTLAEKDEGMRELLFELSELDPDAVPTGLLPPK